MPVKVERQLQYHFVRQVDNPDRGSLYVCSDFLKIAMTRLILKKSKKIVRLQKTLD